MCEVFTMQKFNASANRPYVFVLLCTFTSTLLMRLLNSSLISLPSFG